VIRGYSTAEIEVRQVAKAIAGLVAEGCSPSKIAVLYRVASVGFALQPALRDLQIPYEVRGAGDLWQSVAAKLVVGSLYYLRDGQSVDAMSRMGSNRRADIIRNKLDEAPAVASFAAACELVRKVVASAMPGQAATRDRAEWTSVVEAVVAVASSCRSLNELEAKIAEQSNALRKAPANAVILSTIHSAKGLEWEAVFVVGLEQGVLPHVNNDDLEEERRVAYVGFTRAKRLLGVTYSIERFRQASKPSQFVSEIAGKPRNCIWSDPRSEPTDDRLPLLSDHERRRLDELLRQQSIERPAKRQGRRGKKADGFSPRHGLAWSPEEDARLQARFQNGEAIAAMAKAHQRSAGAIKSRLIKLGVISEDVVVLQ
jgi:DNA helicase-2/ATP-dependent DNA helicase PcrA